MSYYTQKQMTEAVIKWLYDTLGVTFLKASQDSARPDGQYGTVRIILSNDRAHPEQTYEDVDGDDTQLDETIRLWKEVVFSVQVYRDAETTAIDIIRLLELNLRMSSAVEYFAVRGLGLVRVSSVRGFDIEVANALEPRAGIDLTFNVYQTLTVRGDNVEGINITATTINSGGEETENTHLITRNP